MYECVFAHVFLLPSLVQYILILVRWQHNTVKHEHLCLVIYGKTPLLLVDSEEKSQPSLASLDNSPLWQSEEKLH